MLRAELFRMDALGDKGFVDLLDICKQQVLGQKIAFVGLPDGALCASSPPAVCAGGFRDQSRDAWHSIERELLRLARTRTGTSRKSKTNIPARRSASDIHVERTQPLLHGGGASSPRP